MQEKVLSAVKSSKISICIVKFIFYHFFIGLNLNQTLIILSFHADKASFYAIVKNEKLRKRFEPHLYWIS